MASVTNRNDFIMQNHSEEVGKSFVQHASKLPPKKNSITFYLNIFKSYVTICDTMLFADKKKVNNIPLS
jgi:hypothetical protein